MKDRVQSSDKAIQMIYSRNVTRNGGNKEKQGRFKSLKTLKVMRFA